MSSIFQNVLNTSIPKGRDLIGRLGNFLASGSNPKFSTLFKSVNQIGTCIKQRQPAYDAIGEAFSVQNSLINSKVDEVLGENAVLQQADIEYLRSITDDQVNEFTEVEQEEAEAILAGVHDAADALSESEDFVEESFDGVRMTGVTMTSSVGLSYQMLCRTVDDTQGDINGIIAYNRTKAGSIPFIIKHNGRYFLHKILFPLNSSKRNYPTNKVFTRTYSLTQLHIQLCNKYGLRTYPGTLFNRFDSAFKQIYADFPSYETIADIVKYGWARLLNQSVDDFVSIAKSLNDILAGQVLVDDPELDESIYESTLSVGKSIIASGEMNSLMSELCDGICSGSISRTLSMIRQYANSTYSCVRNLWTQVVSAYNNAGLKGIISVIVSLFSSTQAIQLDENGYFIFTDNNNYRPAEYIAGMVCTIIGTAAQIVGMIVSIFYPPVGMVIAALGTVVTMIANSFKGDYSATRASLMAPSSLEEAAELLSCLPLVQGQGTFNITRNDNSWYWWSYDHGNAVVMCDIPGGTIMFGPGEYTGEGNDREPSKIRWEVHVSSTIYGQDATIPSELSGFFRDPSSTKARYVFRKDNCVSDVLKVNEILQSHVLDTISNASDGHLSEDDDKRAFASFCVNSWLIMTFCQACWLDNVASEGFWYATEDNTLEQEPFLHASIPIDKGGIGSVSIGYLGIATGSSYLPDSSNYSGYIDGLNSFMSSSGGSILCKIGYLSGTEWTLNSSWTVSRSNTAYSGIISNRYYAGIPYNYVDGAQYDIILPKYNSTTFWLWISLSAAAVVAISVAAVVCSVKFAQFKRNKRAQNVARFSETQSTYQDAVNGRKSTYNAETKSYDIEEFDVNSAEGQAYIKQCYKDYKRTALTNNLWANIVGGSKYDVGSFWGEKDVDTSSSSLLDSITSYENELTGAVFGDETAALMNNTSEPVSQSLDSLVLLIKGV